METAGIIPPVPVRRFRDGRLTDISRLGSYGASQARKGADGPNATRRRDTMRLSFIAGQLKTRDSRANTAGSLTHAQ